MVAIVVDEQDTAGRGRHLAEALEAPVDALEVLQCADDCVVGNLQLLGDGDRGERVADVMRSGQAQRDLQGRPVLTADNVEARPARIELDVLCAQVGSRIQAVGDNRAANAAHDGTDAGIVTAHDGESVKRQVVQEFKEARAQLLDIAVVGRHVIGVDVGDDREHRLQVHERRIALIGLGNEIFALPEARIRVGALQPPADYEGRIESAFGEHAGNEARGGRLAMGAGYRDRVAETHQLGEHLGTRYDRHK